MSIEQIQEIIGKAITDSEYRQLLLSDPDQALEGYDLTEEEIESLKGLESEQFNEITGELDERISKASLSFTKPVDKASPDIFKLIGGDFKIG